jgi:hypothetical protein
LPADENDFEYIFSTGWILKDIKNKKKIKFWLDDDHGINQKKIDFIRFEARKLKYTLDTSSVIFIEFTDDLLYEELFRIYDNCITDKIQRFATWDDYFVIFGGYPPPKRDTSEYIPLLMCETGAIMQEHYSLNKMKEEHRKRLMIHFRKESLSLYAGWILLLTSFFYFRKKING